MAENKQAMSDEWKAKGNEFLKAGKHDEAIEAYTKGIEADPSNHVLYSNRSAANAKKELYQEALKDAEKVIELSPKWAKGYSRKGSALQFLNRHEEAKFAFEEGLKIEPGNELMKKGLAECEAELTGPAGSQPLGNPFGNLEAIKPRLEQDPRTAKHLNDPSYIKMLKDLGENPKNLQKYLTDPRMSVTLSVLLGFDLQTPPSDAAKPPGGAEKKPEASTSNDEPKIRELDDDEEAMETEECGDEKKALEEKDLGNKAYKIKDFSTALEHYDKAIELDETNITFYTNKAAVYFEQGEHEKCRETCLKAIEIGRDNRADYKLIAKAFARIGNSYMKEKNYDDAVKYFNKSLTEHRVKDTLERLQQCQKALKDVEKKAYINPELSLEEKAKGNESFQKGKYPDAIKHYTEAIKRNPDDAKLYSNRAAAYMKLMEFNLALKDSDACIRIDPTFVKGYIRKGAAHEAMKENAQAKVAFQKALDLDPNAKEATEGFIRCMNFDRENRHNPEEVRKRAMNDPEVQQIMSDPAMKLILEQMQEDPKAVRDHLSNPEIAKKIQKLMDVGLLSIR